MDGSGGGTGTGTGTGDGGADVSGLDSVFLDFFLFFIFYEMVIPAD